jgi:hypothetical protein
LTEKGGRNRQLGNIAYEKLYNLYLLFTRYYWSDKLKRMRWVRYLACMREMRNHEILVRKYVGKRLFGRRRFSWEDNIKILLKD